MSGKRIVAWVDGVGGFLICLGEEVVLGQPSVDGADIAVLADLSRRHATIRREGESYVLTPLHRASIDGRVLAGPTVLNDGAQVKLGDTVRMKFHKPHALSASAVLTLESHHKTEPAVDAIVLMSESCIFGPQPRSHICCRDWTDDFVLFRRGSDLQFRTSAPAEVEDESLSTGKTIAGNCRIEGKGFALSFEEI
ncbi:MAG: FHA domain-containing protein [Planctomycetes bacterium]|nr:FHA domain-containing protein [Planctomycetota bacterium]